MTDQTNRPEQTNTDGLNHLDLEECVKRIKSTPIGRIATCSDSGPLVLPVNFAWFEDGIVFRTLRGQKLAAAQDNEVVCFEVDHWDAKNRFGWSVVVRGVASEVTDWAEKEQLENIDLIPWTTEEWRRMWVRVEPSVVTGRELKRHG